MTERHPKSANPNGRGNGSVSIAPIGFVCMFLGPVLSLVLGFITYVLLDFSYGAGANTEGTATPTQQYYSSIAQPAGVCIAVGGIVLSIWLDFLTRSTEG